MAKTAQERLAEIRQNQTAQERLAQVAPQQDNRGMIDVLADNISRPFNKGLVDTVNLPIDLGNLVMSMFTDSRIPGADDLRASTEQLGLTSPEGQQAEGILPRGMELLGASVLPGGALQSAGRSVIKQGIPLVQQSVPQYIASQTAANPAATLAADVVGSFSGASGGEVARQFTDDPGTIASAELAAGLGVPSIVGAAPKIASTVAEKLPVTGSAIRAGKALKESFNTTDRQINRLRELSADPEKASAKIDVNSPVSPARQTEEPRVIALEEQILREAPADVAQAHRQRATEAADKAKQNAKYFSGDPEEPRRVLKQKAKDQVDRVKAKAEKALEEAETAISQLDSGASPRDISRVERENLENAMHQARKDESAVWGEIDQAAPANAQNTRKAMDDLQATESDLVLDDMVPKEVKALLKKYDQSLEPPKEGEEAIQFTLKDLQSVRSAIGDQIRKLRADGEWNKARILGKFQQSLLDDMSDVDAAGIDRARAFSRELNEKFTQGEVGKLLKLSETGVKAVDDPETFSQLLKGESVTRGIQQFVKASPGSRDSIAEFISNRFALQATNPDGSINQAAAKRVTDRLRNQGVFEEFPELEAQLLDAAKKSAKAANYQKRVDIVKKRGGARLEHDSNESLASIYLKQPVGKETEVLFKAKNPVQLAIKLRRAMSGNENAEKGLRRSFAEALLRQAETNKLDDTGEAIINGAKYGKLIKDHLPTLRALGFSDAQITRLQRSAATLRQLQISPEKGAVSAVMEDNPAWFLQIPARVLGARVGGKAGGGTAGGSIQTANIFANRFEKILEAITVDRAKSGLIDMLDDKALWKAFMLGEKAPKVEQEKALKAIETWLYGLGADVISEQAQEASEP